MKWKICCITDRHPEASTEHGAFYIVRNDENGFAKYLCKDGIERGSTGYSELPEKDNGWWATREDAENFLISYLAEKTNE